MHACECPRSPEEGAGSSEPELQVVVSWLTWVLGTKLWSFARAVRTLNREQLSSLRCDYIYETSSEVW